jgi:exodeoxyribonuclease X
MPVIKVIDFETTSESPETGVVIESGVWNYRVDGGDIWHEEDRLYYAESIPPENRAIHHISPEDLESRIGFDGDSFATWLDMCGTDAIAAHNASFEVSWFTALHPVICTYKSALRVWPSLKSHSNGAVFYWLLQEGKIQPDMSLTQPTHRAGPDAYVTAWILKALFDEGFTGRQMVAWTKEPALLPTCPIGEHRGKPWADVPTGFIEWMIRKPVEPDLVWNAQRELDRRNG